MPTTDLPDDEDLSFDNFESLLLNADEQKAWLKKLKDSCVNFHTKLEHNITESILKRSEGLKRLERSIEELAQLENEKTELKLALGNVRLEQKVVEKKTMKSMNEIEKIKTDIKSIEENKEKMALEMVDLEQEYDKLKDYMKKQWNALKKACKIYKDLLDIHIAVEMIDYVEHVTVTFFQAENPTDKQFFVVLIFQDSCWKVKKIEPELSVENKCQLNQVVQFSNLSKVENVTKLLCELRKLFLKNYF